MRHPLVTAPVAHRKRWWIAVFVATLIVGAMLAVVDTALAADDGQGIIAFEFAGAGGEGVSIMDAWRANGVLDQAGFSLGLDYLYMVLYALVLAGAALAMGGRARRKGRRGVARLAETLAWAAFAAAAFDAAENAGLLAALDNPTRSDEELAFARLCASVKFALLAGVLLYIIVAGTVTLLRRRERA